MRPFERYLVALWLLLPWWIVAQQRPYVQVISDEHQFGQGTITMLLEDHQGILWAGSYLGLLRFDGIETTIYRPEPGNPNSISSEFVYYLYEDSRHNLWIATRNGLNCLDPSRRFFTRYLMDSGDPASIPNNRIFSLLPYSDSTFYLFCDRSELSSFNTLTRSVTRLNPALAGQEEPLPEGSLWATRGMRSRNGKIIIGTRRGNYEYSSAANILLPVSDTITGYQALSSRGFLYPDRDGTLWFAGPEQRIYAWVPGESLESWHLPELKPAIETGTAAIQDFDHRHILISTRRGYWRLHRQTGVLSRLQFRQDQEHLLQSNIQPEGQITYCLETRDSIIVMGTVKGDLYMINPRLQQFGFTQVLPSDPLFPDQVQNVIGDCFDDTAYQKRYISVVRDSFFYVQDLITGHISRHKKPMPSPIESKWLCDSRGRLWLSNDLEVLSVDRKNQSLVSYKPEPPKRNLFKMVEVQPGKMLVGSFLEGLYWFDPANGQFTGIPEERGWIRTQVFSMKADLRRRCIWMGTVRNGLLRYDIDRDTFYHFTHDTRNPGSLGGDWVRDIALDSSGYVWFATDPIGLSRFDYAAHPDSAFINVSMEQGLPSNFIAGIGTDPDGYVWMTSLNGMARLDPRHMSLLYFGKGDGLPGTRFNRANLVFTPEGTAIAGMQTGYIYFKTDSLLYNPHPPRIVIRDVLVYDTSRMSLDDEGRVAPLCLGYKENFLTILFSVINYTESELNTVRYIMEGLEESWNMRSGITRVSYTNLPPGDYTFRILAANNDGIWNEAETRLAIEIRPPFWQRTWFYLLIAGFAGSIIAFFYQYKLSQSIARNKLMAEKETLRAETEKQLAQLEMKALRAQMNPHFIFNCLNSINRFIIINDNDTASEYLTKFSKLIRQTLDSSRGEQVSLGAEIETLRLYMEMESLRFADKFEFSIEVDPALQAEEFMVQPMLIQPYVENAIWHGLMHRKSKGRLDLAFTRNGNALKVVVGDNGVGRVMARKIRETQVVHRKSHGMSVTAERMSLLSKKLNVPVAAVVEDLYDDEGMATGTRVILTLPLEAGVGGTG